MRHLDTQMSKYSTRLCAEVGVDGTAADRLATTVAADLRFLPAATKSEILLSSPVDVAARLDELIAFQSFMEQINAAKSNPAMIRAQVMYQNYMCFVYLGEACFRVLAKSAPTGSASRKCSRFLTDNPVRAFRNAIAHGNWTYRSDFSGLVFWARKGSDASEPLSQFEVAQDELDFWQSLARCVGYAAYTHLRAGAA
jgi:hypothetical protein